MDFDSAIQAHTNWKLRLFSYSRGMTAEKINVQPLLKDNVCALGQWLYGDGRKYAADRKFKQLLALHADFHRSAASIGNLIDRGQMAAATALLSSQESEFNRLSIRVVAFLMDLRNRGIS